MLLLQQADDVLRIVTARELTVGGLLLGMCIYLGWQLHLKKKEIEDKDERIREVIKEHQNDLKEATKDGKELIEKYHQFTQQLKEIVNARKVQ